MKSQLTTTTNHRPGSLSVSMSGDAGNRAQGGPNGDWVISDIHARLDQLERTRPSNFSAGLPEKPAAASEPPAASTSPAAAEQDGCEEIHCLCTEFVPGWKDLGMGDLSVKKFSAGCSGAMVAKVSTKQDVVPQSVMFKSGAHPISGAALEAFRQAGDTTFGEVYLAGHPDHPRILITECGELGSPKDVLELFGAYGKSFGSTLGALHSRDSSWFDAVEHLAGWPSVFNDTAVGIMFDSVAAGLRGTSRAQARNTQRRRVLCFAT